MNSLGATNITQRCDFNMLSKLTSVVGESSASLIDIHAAKSGQLRAC